MKVSVIMSCTDRLRNLRNTLTSWSGITYPDYEFFLFDNGSTYIDGVRNIVVELASKFREWHFLRISQITAVNRLWNMGARMSTGDYVVFAMADELSSPDVLERMVAHGEQRCSVNTLFLSESMTNQLASLDWISNPRVIESLSGFWEYEDKGSTNAQKTDASLLSHIIGWPREKWDWFGWFRENERGHLWLDQDVVIRSRVLRIETKTVEGISCYHQYHPTPVNPEWLAPGYHPVNERQSRLLEESERDKS